MYVHVAHVVLWSASPPLVQTPMVVPMAAWAFVTGDRALQDTQRGGRKEEGLSVSDRDSLLVLPCC